MYDVTHVVLVHVSSILSCRMSFCFLLTSALCGRCFPLYLFDYLERKGVKIVKRGSDCISVQFLVAYPEGRFVRTSRTSPSYVPAIPRVEDLFILCPASRGEYYNKQELCQTYQQLPFIDESKQCVVKNARKDCFNISDCLMHCGISSALVILPKMENLLKVVPGVVMYMGDILVTGSTHEKDPK